MSRTRWGKLLQEVTASEPMIVCLQEVCFRQGIAHMAYTARACPRYVPMSFHDQAPDQIFLIMNVCINTAACPTTEPSMPLYWKLRFREFLIFWS